LGAAGSAVASSLIRPQRATAASLGSTQIFSGADPGAFAGLFMADKQGYFSAAGVDATVALFPSGATATEAFLANGTGFVASGDLPALRLWERANGDVVGVLPLMWDDVTFCMIANAEIKSPADLKGKKIATRLGSTGHIYVANYVRMNHLSGAVEVINLDADTMMPALLRKDIAAFCWSGVVIEQTLVTVPGAHYLNQGSKGYVTNHCLISAERKTLVEQSALSKAVLAAISRGTDDVARDPAKTAQVLGASLKIDPAKIAAILQGVHYSSVYDAKWRTDMFEMSKTAVEIGAMKAPTDLSRLWNAKVAATIDKRFVS
jgi:ABC-type nitrate/sulfonate/bicarbonate transport system substrate-binding protein